MMMRRRGPGLVRGVARTAVVAGTATAVSGRVARRQAAKFEQKDQAAYEQQQAAPEQVAEPAYAEASPAEPDVADEIRQLGELKDQGLITEEEFAAKKKQILGI
jgi:hypothetical protein